MIYLAIAIAANIIITIIAAALLWRKLGQIQEDLQYTDSVVANIFDLITQNPHMMVGDEMAPQLMKRLYGSK